MIPELITMIILAMVCIPLSLVFFAFVVKDKHVVPTIAFVLLFWMGLFCVYNIQTKIKEIESKLIEEVESVDATSK